MITKQVTVSGSVGKQVYNVSSGATSAGVKDVTLLGYSIYTPTSASTVVIRHGDASGDVMHEGQGVLDEPTEFLFPGGMRFDRGMHVKVTGKDSVAYLYIN